MPLLIYQVEVENGIKPESALNWKHGKQSNAGGKTQQKAPIQTLTVCKSISIRTKVFTEHYK